MRAQKAPPLVIPGLASPYRRLWARLIDLAVGGFVIFPLSFIFIAPLSQVMGNSDSESAFFGLLSVLIVLALMIVYDTLMTALLGRTLGKMALGLRVVNIEGDKPTWGQSLLRAFLLYLSGLLILMGIVITASILGWIFIAGLGKTQVYPHEKASKTYVMLKGYSTVAAEVPKVTPHDDLERLLESGMITEDEYNRKRKEIGY
jgi:uncharacterized RDD family membrane protein YckC